MDRESLLERLKVGQLVSSKQGRDKNHLYVIVSEDNYFFYVADGSRWTVAEPKKKNARHLQLINVNIQTERQMLDDVLITQVIKDFENRNAN